MPWMQAIVERANTQFNSMNIGAVDPALLEPGKSLMDAATALGIVTNMQESRYFGFWPSSLQQSLRATLYDAVTRQPRVPVQFSWSPAPSFFIGAWEVAGVEGSWTAITVELKSPLPARTG